MAAQNLSNNSIGRAGIAALAAHLKNNRVLVSLNLSGALRPRCERAHTRAGRSNARRCVRAGNQLHDRDARCVRELLELNTALTTLDLSHNHFSETLELGAALGTSATATASASATPSMHSTCTVLYTCSASIMLSSLCT